LKTRGFGLSARPVAASRGATARPSSGDLICPSGNRSSRRCRAPTAKRRNRPRHCPFAIVPVNGGGTVACRERRAAGPVAQWLEPAAHNGLVAGSSPAGPTIFVFFRPVLVRMFMFDSLISLANRWSNMSSDADPHSGCRAMIYHSAVGRAAPPTYPTAILLVGPAKSAGHARTASRC
jgi:hypothetical protein